MRRTLLPLILTALATAPLRAQIADHLGSGQIHSTNDMSSVAALTAAMRSPIAGQPFEGRKVTRSVWKLSDGTVITHESDTLMARDGEGRIREELQNTQSSSIDGKQLDHSTETVTIADPVGHSVLMLTPKLKMAMKMTVPDVSSLGGKSHRILAAPPPPSPPTRHGPSDAVRLGSTSAEARLSHPAERAADSDTIRTEDLGKQSIAGVLATGKRTTTTIPLGKIGNDRPISIVHEEWYSPDLQLVVKSIDTDPRDGERTMELEGVSRAEPDAALFKVPDDYKVKDMADIMKSLSSLGNTRIQTGSEN